GFVYLCPVCEGHSFMRILCSLSCVLGLLLVNAGLVRADDQAEAKSLIDKAIKAAGGERNLGRFQAFTWKERGTFHGVDIPIPYTGEVAIQWPDRRREVINGEVMGREFKIVVVQVR